MACEWLPDCASSVDAGGTGGEVSPVHEIGCESLVVLHIDFPLAPSLEACKASSRDPFNDLDRLAPAFSWWHSLSSSRQEQIRQLDKGSAAFFSAFLRRGKQQKYNGSGQTPYSRPLLDLCPKVNPPRQHGSVPAALRYL